jgi:hypothetical protein
MHKIFLLMMIATFSLKAGMGQTAELTKPGKASYEWKSKLIDLGSLKLNHPQTVEFKVKNTGEVPVAITRAEGSCGCTQIVYPQEPIKAGETGIVKATYNAASQGVFTKTVRVTMSDGDSETLTIKGVVE